MGPKTLYAIAGRDEFGGISKGERASGERGMGGGEGGCKMSKIAAPLGGVIMSNQPSEVAGREEGTENTQNEKRKRNESVREYQITLDMEMSSWRRRQTGGQAGRQAGGFWLLHWWQILLPASEQVGEGRIPSQICTRRGSFA